MLSKVLLQNNIQHKCNGHCWGYSECQSMQSVIRQ